MSIKIIELKNKAVKITKLNRVIRKVKENIFRNGDATICKTTAYIYLPYYSVDHSNENKIFEILSGAYGKDGCCTFNSDYVGGRLFRVFPVSQTSCVVKHKDDVDDQHLANVLAKQKAMRKIEGRVIRALHFLYRDIGQKRDEIDGLLRTYQMRHNTSLNSQRRHLNMVQSK